MSLVNKGTITLTIHRPNLDYTRPELVDKGFRRIFFFSFGELERSRRPLPLRRPMAPPQCNVNVPTWLDTFIALTPPTPSVPPCRLGISFDYHLSC